MSTSPATSAPGGQGESLTATKAWKALESHYDGIRSAQMRDLFASDAQRGERQRGPQPLGVLRADFRGRFRRQLHVGGDAHAALYRPHRRAYPPGRRVLVPRTKRYAGDAAGAGDELAAGDADDGCTLGAAEALPQRSVPCLSRSAPEP